MPESDKVSVEGRAKELCEQDGFVWELAYKPEPNRPPRLVSEERRQEYLARAQAEHSQEGRNA